MIIVSLNHGESGLIQVAETQQLVSLRTDIADLQCHLAVDLLLQVQVVVLHIRRAEVLIHTKTVRHQTRKTENRAKTERAARRGGYRDRMGGGPGIGRSRIVKSVERQGPTEQIPCISVTL